MCIGTLSQSRGDSPRKSQRKTGGGASFPRLVHLASAGDEEEPHAHARRSSRRNGSSSKRVRFEKSVIDVVGSDDDDDRASEIVDDSSEYSMEDAGESRQVLLT